MPEISQLNQSNVMRTALDSNQKTQKSSATANHLQLGGVTIKTVNSSDFEEMAMNLTNLKGLPKDKKDKK
ncbi:MAG: hypothetical protein HAW67_00500, partial [Endozoicomonadaceae bacterium]|nr:hypothetical protein [Endozoicomonadaceae bacterium]